MPGMLSVLSIPIVTAIRLTHVAPGAQLQKIHKLPSHSLEIFLYLPNATMEQLFELFEPHCSLVSAGSATSDGHEVRTTRIIIVSVSICLVLMTKF